ncbi:hypothetical protein [Serratia marcescens]|nr:hypothetical protein [Serratia marcescens]
MKRRNLHGGDSARQHCEVFQQPFRMIFGCGRENKNQLFIKMTAY